MGLKNNFNTTMICSTFMLLLATSCGGSKSGGGSSAAPTPVRVPVQTTQEEVVLGTEGMYRAVLIPLNSHLPHETVGTVTIKVYGDEFVAQTVVNGSPAGIKHFQYINAGSECPTVEDDNNADNFIDIVEAQKKTGSILIPLDSKLSNQFEGMDYGPIANARGAFVYKRSAPLTYIELDLHAKDPSSTDGMTKLHTGENLNLAGRIVTLHGSATALPQSVGTFEEMTAKESLPIACGRLVRLSTDEERVIINEPAPAPTVEDDRH